MKQSSILAGGKRKGEIIELGRLLRSAAIKTKKDRQPLVLSSPSQYFIDTASERRNHYGS